MSAQVSINPSFFASAPTSPSSPFHQNMCFYSVPNSPSKRTLDSTSVLTNTNSTTSSTTTSTTTTPKSCDGLNLDDIEFETNRRFSENDLVYHDDDDSDSDSSDDTIDYQQERLRKHQRKRHESLPAMAFADELFCEGKVMPLNPPPCQKYSNGNATGGDHKAGKFSLSPNSIYKIPFTKRSLWNDDFDPFVEALETVKKGRHHRRAWSMLPLRAFTHWNSDEIMKYDHQNCLHASPVILCPTKPMEANGSPAPIWMSPQRPVNEGSKSPIRLAEPKGVLFARRARIVQMGMKMGIKYPPKPTTTAVPHAEPMVQGGDHAGLSARPCHSGNKWHRIMSFSFRSSSMNRASNEQKHRGHNEEFSRPKILRKLSFSSKKLVHGNEEKAASQMTKMTLVRYRPKLLLCMGYGAKYAK